LSSPCLRWPLTPMLTPLHCDRPRPGPLTGEADHAQTCTDPKCDRCLFSLLFSGRARKGRRDPNTPESTTHAYKNRFTFPNPQDGKIAPWLTVRPPSWGGPWAFGCYVCNAARQQTLFGRIEATQVQSQAMVQHQKSAAHADALKILQASCQDDQIPLTTLEPSGLPLNGGLEGGVPRLDRWLMAASVVERGDSFADMERARDASSVGSILDQGEGVQDTSRKTCSRLLRCLAEPLRWRDLEALANSTSSSIGIDERAGVLLVYCRTYARKTQELYECLLGLVRGHGTSPGDCRQAIEQVVARAFTVNTGREVGEEVSRGVVAQDLLRRFRHSVRSAVADGGPTEQRALYDASPGTLDPSCRADPFFPNLVDISRDRAHKWRSVQKGIWKNVDSDIKIFLDELVTGERSLARMLQTSRKYQVLFEATTRRRWAPPPM
jgi:hypothetical protein